RQHHFLGVLRLGILVLRSGLVLVCRSLVLVLVCSGLVFVLVLVAVLILVLVCNDLVLVLGRVLFLRVDRRGEKEHRGKQDTEQLLHRVRVLSGGRMDVCFQGRH